MFAWFFISALYLQLVLGYNAMQVGLSFLPANLIMAAFSLGLSAKIVMRFGIRAPLGARPAARRGRAWRCSRARRSTGNFWIDVLPGMALLGMGCGYRVQPAAARGAMSDVAPHESGLASGIVNTAFMMGGALGLAVLASFAAMRTEAHARRRRRMPPPRSTAAISWRSCSVRLRGGRRGTHRRPSSCARASRPAARADQRLAIQPLPISIRDEERHCQIRYTTPAFPPATVAATY